MTDDYRKRICIIGYSPRKIAPYLQRYIAILNELGCDYDYITREIEEDPLDLEIENNQYVVRYARTNNQLRKIFQILKWRRAVEKILKNNEYDRIIVLTVYPAVILGSFLYRRYNGKYIIDIRDYVELLRHVLLKQRLKSVICGAQFTVVSSMGFLSWLPSKERVFAIHNSSRINISDISMEDLSKKENIVIGYLGVIAYVETNLKLIMDLAQNPRYSMYYAGIYKDNGFLETICEKEKITNVVFHGEFDNNERAELYKHIDLINAIYGNNSIIVRSALPNKLYDSALYKKPILVSSGTYLATIVEKYHLGVSIDINKEITGQIDSYISNFCVKDFVDGADKFLSICADEEEKTIVKLKTFLAN